MDITNHYFNENLKRFEPKLTRCKFCNKKESTSQDKNHFVPIFQEAKRTNIIVYSSVNYSKLQIGVPRCNDCYYEFIRSKQSLETIYWLAIPAVIIFGFYQFGFYGVYVGIFFPIVGMVLFPYFYNTFIKNKGLKTYTEVAEEDNLVLDFLISGWSLKQPTA